MFVYKITINNECYIGSTNKIEVRYKQHKHNCTNEEASKYNLPLYKYIREHGGWEEIEFSILACIDCGRSLTLENQKKIEQKYLEKYKPTINTNKAYVGLPKAEYDKLRYEKRKEKLREKVECIVCKKFVTRSWLKNHCILAHKVTTF